jgi:hypothetical protein
VHYLKPRPKGDHSGVTLVLNKHAVPYAAGLISYASWFRWGGRRRRRADGEGGLGGWLSDVGCARGGEQPGAWWVGPNVVWAAAPVRACAAERPCAAARPAVRSIPAAKKSHDIINTCCYKCGSSPSGP